MIVDFINNVALLITLSAFYGIFIRLRKRSRTLSGILVGSWFGLVAIAGMMVPFVYQPGAIFDGRSIVLSLAGLFGGGIASAISVFFAGLYRAHIGGPGVWAGLATIVFCTLAGLLFRRFYQNKPEEISLINLLLFGILIHLIMLACQLLFPWPSGITIIGTIWLPVLIVFPVAFLLMSVLLAGQEKRYLGMIALKQAETLYRTTIYSIGDGVITTNNKGNIVQMNRLAEKITGFTEKEAAGKHLDEILKISSDQNQTDKEPLIKKVLKSKITEELSGRSIISANGTEIPVSMSASPIKDEDGKIPGVVIVMHDQTEDRARQKLLESNEAKYRELVESTDAISWEYDMEEDRCTYIAPQVEEKLGWQPHEWTGFSFWENNIHPDDRKRTIEQFKKMAAGGEKHALEYRFFAKNGKTVWIRDEISVETNHNHPVKFRGIMLDITVRKKMELDLKEKNHFIQMVLDYLPIGLILYKIDDRTLTYVNRRFEEIYGWKREDIKQTTSFFEKIIPASFPKSDLPDTTLSRNELYRENIEITRKDGSLAIIDAVNIPLFEQNIIVSAVMDVTMQKIAEQALKESEEHFRKLFENHSAVHLLIDSRNGEIVNANQAASEFYGYPIDQLKTMKIHQINTLPPDEINKAINLAKEKNKFHFEFKHRLANGDIRDVEVFSSAVELRGREYIYSIVHDITEKKELINEIIEAKTRAEENDRLKSAFLANMSHEIRTPLNGILGFTELLTTNQTLSNDKKEKYSKIIQKSAASLMQIINDILDISKLETGQMRISKRKIPINLLLDNLLTIYSVKISDSNKPLTLQLHNPFGKTEILTDENRITQIFTNLLDNSIKFTHTGTINFGISEIGTSHITFFVSDTGIGIAKDKQKLVFDRFAQAGEEISTNYGGNGLGLSIVKKLSELMGGSIMVESEPGKGTTFSFTMPYPG